MRVKRPSAPSTAPNKLMSNSIKFDFCEWMRYHLKDNRAEACFSFKQIFRDYFATTIVFKKCILTVQVLAVYLHIMSSLRY